MSQSPFLDKAERRVLVPVSDSTADRMEQRGEFPRRLVIGKRRVVWRRSEIEDWARQHGVSLADHKAG
jgi:predicted DNA-binding transcriptional regulator AlpA